MPQLDFTTFPSQIFWILIGFLMVYYFVSRVVTPDLEDILKNRASHVDELLQNAKQLKEEAESLEKNSLIAMENAGIEMSSIESEMLSSFMNQSMSEKNTLYSMFSEKSKAESLELSKSANDVANHISNSIDVIIDDIIDKINIKMADK